MAQETSTNWDRLIKLYNSNHVFKQNLEGVSTDGTEFRLSKYGGCLDGRVTMSDQWGKVRAVVGDHVEFLFETGVPWYYGRVEAIQRTHPAGVVLQTYGLINQLSEVYPASIQAPVHFVAGGNSTFYHDPDRALRTWPFYTSSGGSTQSYPVASSLTDLLTLWLRYWAPSDIIVDDVDNSSNANIHLTGVAYRELLTRGGQSMLSLIREIAMRAGNFCYGVDENRKFFFRPRDILGSTDLPFEVVDAGEIREKFTITSEVSRDGMINDLVIFGGYMNRGFRDGGSSWAAGVPLDWTVRQPFQQRFFAGASVEQFGPRRMSIVVPHIRTLVDAKEFATKFFAVYSLPIARYHITIPQENRHLKPWADRYRVYVPGIGGDYGTSGGCDGSLVQTDNIGPVDTYAMRVKWGHTPEIQLEVGPPNPEELFDTPADGRAPHLGEIPYSPPPVPDPIPAPLVGRFLWSCIGTVNDDAEGNSGNRQWNWGEAGDAAIDAMLTNCNPSSQTETLYPDGVEDAGTWSGSATDVDEGTASHDGNTTTMSASATGTAILDVDNPTLGLLNYTSIEIKVAARMDVGLPGPDLTFGARIDSASIGTKTVTLTQHATDYVVYTHTITGSWTSAQIQTLEITLERESAPGPTMYVTATEAIVTTTSGCDAGDIGGGGVGQWSWAWGTNPLSFVYEPSLGCSSDRPAPVPHHAYFHGGRYGWVFERVINQNVFYGEARLYSAIFVCVYFVPEGSSMQSHYNVYKIRVTRRGLATDSYIIQDIYQQVLGWFPDPPGKDLCTDRSFVWSDMRLSTGIVKWPPRFASPVGGGNIPKDIIDGNSTTEVTFTPSSSVVVNTIDPGQTDHVMASDEGAWYLALHANPPCYATNPLPDYNGYVGNSDSGGWLNQNYWRFADDQSVTAITKIEFLNNSNGVLFTVTPIIPGG